MEQINLAVVIADQTRHENNIANINKAIVAFKRELENAIYHAGLSFGELSVAPVRVISIGAGNSVYIVYKVRWAGAKGNRFAAGSLGGSLWSIVSPEERPKEVARILGIILEAAKKGAGPSPEEKAKQKAKKELDTYNKLKKKFEGCAN